MGFLSNVFSAAVKVALAPVAIVKDVVNVATWEEVDDTKKLLESAGEDIDEAIDNIT